MAKENHNGQETIIAQGVKVEGDFTSQGHVVIDGDVSGTVSVGESLRIGESAHIQANITAASATIAGEVRGNVRVADRLELLETSIVEGDVEAQVLSIAPGARLSGRVEMGSVKEKK